MIPDIRTLDITLLLAFDALYEERSVTRAANRLALTQPTVSGMLKRLRDLFDDDLYIRTSHGVFPTPRAEALAEPVKHIIWSTQSLLRPQTFDPSVAEFDVKLSGSDYIQMTLLGPLTASILERAPGARISLTLHPAGDLDMALARGDVDILFSSHNSTSSRPEGLVLRSDKLACVSSYPNHRTGQEISLEDLCALSHITLTPFGSSVSQNIETTLAERGLKRNVVTTAPSFAAVFQAMRYAPFIAFLPEQMAELYWDHFKHLKVELKTQATDVVARWHPRMNNDPRHIWIREKLLETVSALDENSLPKNAM
ncbi:MAG: LysR family transcriptional regulator [Rhizobiaceae bacterium]